jgi:hypothetical protein
VDGSGRPAGVILLQWRKEKKGQLFNVPRGTFIPASTDLRGEPPKAKKTIVAIITTLLE